MWRPIGAFASLAGMSPRGTPMQKLIHSIAVLLGALLCACSGGSATGDGFGSADADAASARIRRIPTRRTRHRATWMAGMRLQRLRAPTSASTG